MPEEDEDEDPSTHSRSASISSVDDILPLKPESTGPVMLLASFDAPAPAAPRGGKCDDERAPSPVRGIASGLLSAAAAGGGGGGGGRSGQTAVGRSAAGQAASAQRAGGHGRRGSPGVVVVSTSPPTTATATSVPSPSRPTTGSRPATGSRRPTVGRVVRDPSAPLPVTAPVPGGRGKRGSMESVEDMSVDALESLVTDAPGGGGAVRGRRRSVTQTQQPPHQQQQQQQDFSWADVDELNL